MTLTSAGFSRLQTTHPTSAIEPLSLTRDDNSNLRVVLKFLLFVTRDEIQSMRWMMHQFQLSIGDLLMFEVSDHSRNIEGLFRVLRSKPASQDNKRKANSCGNPASLRCWDMFWLDRRIVAFDLTLLWQQDRTSMYYANTSNQVQVR